jgi:hypothetical protein
MKAPRGTLLGLLACGALSLGLATLAAAQYSQEKPEQPKDQPAHKAHEEPKTPAKATAKGVTLDATLVERDIKAKKQEAAVEVKVSGLEIVDPGKANEKAAEGQGHIHYQLDDGPMIATTATKLSFHGLKPGQHTIMVMLAGNDHSPLGPQKRLELTVPQGGTAK